MQRIHIVAVVALLSIRHLESAFGQDKVAAPVRVTFDVAAIKWNTSGDLRSTTLAQMPDGLSATNQTLRALIGVAYRLPQYKISGGPAWIGSERYDINAKSDHRLAGDERLRMLQSLLEDRFMLKMKSEMREGRVYSLTLARSDGKLGPDLRPRPDVDCAALAAARQRGEGPPASKKTQAPPECTALRGPAQFSARAISIGSFVLTLGAMISETVIDRTGLAGSFDIDLHASFDALGTIPDGMSDVPSLSTALIEQLGLALNSERGMVESYIVEKAERPISD